MAALETRLLAEADLRDLARKSLHWGSTSDWFTHLAGLTRREGRRAVAHAQQLVAELPETLEALRRGETSATQAAVICDAVDTLPSSPALRSRGEQVLLEESRRLNATELARTARHLAAVVDPDRTERRDEAALDREERAAHTGRFFSVTEDGAGGVWIKGRGSTEDGAVLRAALLPLTKPAPAVDPDTPGCEAETDPRDHGARMFDALVELAQHALDTDRAPASHGARPRVAVTVDYQCLVSGLGSGPWPEICTDDGLRLSVAAVRRLACDADLIPVCLGTDGEVLDVGRTHGSSPPPCGGPSWPATGTAPSPAAPAHRSWATPTTSCTGPTAATPPSATSSWSAASITASCTTRRGRFGSTPTTASPSSSPRRCVAPPRANRMDPPPTPSRVRSASNTSRPDGRRGP